MQSGIKCSSDLKYSMDRDALVNELNVACPDVVLCHANDLISSRSTMENT